MLKTSFKVLTDVNKIMKTESERTRKAASTALKREGFLLAAELRKDIKAGRAGGQMFAKLASMARRSGNRFITRTPFTKLWSTRQATGASKGLIPVRYNPVMGSDGLQVDVGFTDTRQEKLSKSWLKIGERLQEGYTQKITKEQRRYLARAGGAMPKGSKLRKHMFLRKGTATFKTPPRPFIDPFYSKWRLLSPVRIKTNFDAKMRGERI